MIVLLEPHQDESAYKMVSLESKISEVKYKEQSGIISIINDNIQKRTKI